MLPLICLKTLQVAVGCAHSFFVKDWNSFFYQLLLFPSAGMTCNIFMFESKQCSSAAFREVSCCRNWGSSTTANFSAVLWIRPFRWKTAWSLMESFAPPKGLPSLLLPPAPCEASSSCFHQFNNIHSCNWVHHTLVVNQSILLSCLTWPYMKYKYNGIMFYCMKSNFSHNLWWRILGSKVAPLIIIFNNQ